MDIYMMEGKQMDKNKKIIIIIVSAATLLLINFLIGGKFWVDRQFKKKIIILDALDQ